MSKRDLDQKRGPKNSGDLLLALVSTLAERLTTGDHELEALGLVTGLLGINLAGILGAESASSFPAFCGFWGAVAVFWIWLYRRWGWF